MVENKITLSQLQRHGIMWAAMGLRSDKGRVFGKKRIVLLFPQTRPLEQVACEERSRVDFEESTTSTLLLKRSKVNRFFVPLLPD